ncbi:hypothetical protein PG985_016052 [Apiospora marii]|uniref:uncharacterized protein n=1 Tax=Apiospora marii TaxID=335849 RepID=UPI00313225F1
MQPHRQGHLEQRLPAPLEEGVDHLAPLRQDHAQVVQQLVRPRPVVVALLAQQLPHHPVQRRRVAGKPEREVARRRQPGQDAVAVVPVVADGGHGGGSAVVLQLDDFEQEDVAGLDDDGEVHVQSLHEVRHVAQLQYEPAAVPVGHLVSLVHVLSQIPGGREGTLGYILEPLRRRSLHLRLIHFHGLVYMTCGCVGSAGVHGVGRFAGTAGADDAGRFDGAVGLPGAGFFGVAGIAGTGAGLFAGGSGIAGSAA